MRGTPDFIAASAYPERAGARFNLKMARSAEQAGQRQQRQQQHPPPPSARPDRPRCAGGLPGLAPGGDAAVALVGSGAIGLDTRTQGLAARRTLMAPRWRRAARRRCRWGSSGQWKRQPSMASSKLPTTAKPAPSAARAASRSPSRPGPPIAAGRCCLCHPVFVVIARQTRPDGKAPSGGPHAQCRQNGEPAQHAKHMAVRGNDRVLDHMAHDLAARQLPHLRPAASAPGAARAASSSADSRASRMRVKWWLNWRKPSVI